MPFKKLLVLLLFISFLFNCEKRENTIAEVLIIPQPNELTINEGQLILGKTIGISSNQAFKVSIDFLKQYIENNSDFSVEDGKDIQFVFDAEIDSDEEYLISVTPETIRISAKTDHGAFYAVQTLRQLLSTGSENGSSTDNIITIPCLAIKDGPQFSYRGMHLDVGRHMYSVDFIKKYIDALAMLKMNTFHWHLTEDQGWRIEIKKYPKLQEVAAFRDETLVGHYSDQPHQFDGEKYGGYYTQEQIKDIVAYAQERFVTIIPEIELPGHSQAAIAAYPELGCTGEQVEVVTKWGVFEEIYCPKEETFKFLEDVLDEVLELFPSKYIHIGGDEAPKTRWKNCDHCQDLIKKEGLQDEHELQSYFIKRIENYLNFKGRQIIGWDEILEGGLAPNATVMSWRGTQGAITAAQQSHDVVMTPTSHCYFDYYQSENENEPLAIGGYLPLEKVYSFNPIPDELTQEQSKFIIGAQGNVWTEYMPSEKQVEYMAFPRMLAMSEVVWTNPKNKSYKDFVKRVEHFHKRLDVLDINYANHLYEIDGQLLKNNEGLIYRLSTLTEGKTIRFTTDDSDPTISSEEYLAPIGLDRSMVVKAAVFNNEKRLGEIFSETINLHKAVGAKITIDKQPHKAYSGSGAQGLINGIKGSSKRYGDKEWLGFWGGDIEIIIDLGKEKIINCVNARFYEANGQWIYKPKGVQVELFDNEQKSLYGDTEQLLEPEFNSKNLWRLSVSCEPDEFPIKARFVKINVQNYGTIPEGKQGAGNKAWTFIDEIIVN